MEKEKKQNKLSHFLAGALVGTGLGILLAPQVSSETEKEFQESFNQLIDSIKNVDIEKTKANLFNKLCEIKKEIAGISEEDAHKFVEEKYKIIDNECTELIEIAKKNDIPVVTQAAEDMKAKSEEFLNEVLENVPEVASKKTVKHSKKKQKKNS